MAGSAMGFGSICGRDFSDGLTGRFLVIAAALSVISDGMGSGLGGFTDTACGRVVLAAFSPELELPEAVRHWRELKPSLSPVAGYRWSESRPGRKRFESRWRWARRLSGSAPPRLHVRSKRFGQAVLPVLWIATE